MKYALTLLLALPVSMSVQADDPRSTDGWAGDPPALDTLVEFAKGESDLRVAIDRYVQDRSALGRRYPVNYSPERMERMKRFVEAWQSRLQELDFESMNSEGQVDYILLRNRIRYDMDSLQLDEKRAKEMAPLLPFFDRLRQFPEDRFNRIRVDPRSAASELDRIAREIGDLIEMVSIEPETGESRGMQNISPVIALRASNQLTHLQETLADWNTFYDGYDPMFDFWVPKPYQRVQAGLSDYNDAIRTHLVGVDEHGIPPIIGDPVLADGLRADLAVEMIPYTADELLEIGWAEFKRTEEEFRIVSNRMGFGDDWQAAMEHTKNLAPPPGEKPWIIFDIGEYSENFIEELDTVTLPPLAREIWRLAMQTPEVQLRNPFFLGGEVTRVSYPASSMPHGAKMMSMRGNTPSFNFGTVQHELLPGHHMQYFLVSRFNPHRGELLPTPFWNEGWAFYWEYRLWETDFLPTDEDRIGTLFWRLHRAARIVFSLNFHLGKWSTQESIDFLVDRVGHERANAEAEVRRTTIDAPLYQIAYMIGAIQFRSLYDELVIDGNMDEKDFHDAIMQGGMLPLELVRARLTGQKLSSDFESQWRFYRKD